MNFGMISTRVEKFQEITIRSSDSEPSETAARELISLKAGQQVEIGEIELIKRSLDARPRPPVWELVYRVYPKGMKRSRKKNNFTCLGNVAGKESVAVVGAGPAGLFAALRLIEMGLRPVLVERGKPVRERRKDVATISRGRDLLAESNYCFGEGGAGTFSDGKLYCRSVAKNDRDWVLSHLIEFGGDSNLKIDTHAHVGTNKLPDIISAISDKIVSLGGEIRFDQKVVDISAREASKVIIKLHSGEELDFPAVLLATGHSSPEIYHLLIDKGVSLEPKGFALGVRVEHPRELIDALRHGDSREDLPAASYSLKTRVAGKGVYSFCMCPGGIICPAATREGQLVVNGWSPSKRNSKFSNSGIVVEIDGSEDFLDANDNAQLRFLSFQERIEQNCWSAGVKGLKAPAQRLDSFVEGGGSQELPDCSYNPGIVPVAMEELFPEAIISSLRQGFIDFERKMPGFISSKAVIVAPESRTSAPVRIPRDSETVQVPGMPGVYAAGEGAGYAGGIVSAAIDGAQVASRIAERLC